MDTLPYVLLFILTCGIALSTSETYSVNISTFQHVNVVDSRFLSFTIDPKYLFATNEKYGSKECFCMASSLTPAYLRIAGPSTAHMTFHNTTISINDLDYGLQPDLDISTLDTDSPKKVPINVKPKNLAVSHRQWRMFINWAQSGGFSLVFALNAQQRTAAGMWDPNTALDMLTVAEKTRVGDIFWELGYECTNQSIEEYLNDLETLRVIIETFPPGRTGEWRVVGGDVTKCLQADSKSDFKDYLMLSNDMMDALLLNGNSSYYELQRMTEYDRLKLQRLFYHSDTPLWLTETTPTQYSGFGRAADWLASLGDSAKNGFAVHYRELEEEEIYEPTLSFYMALLFKNLVGERVLDVQMVPEQAVLYAHCTSLRHKPIVGAVTLYAANMDDEPARFSIKLSKKEEGGDIMQFILGLDHNGNIVVNGRPMYYEGDLKPVVKRVRPYKTLLINLPPKSFGFWVLANTKIEACSDVGTEKTDNENNIPKGERIKRSIIEDFEDLTTIADISYDFDEDNDSIIANKALQSRITDMNKDLDRILTIFKANNKRFKRDDTLSNLRAIKRQGLRTIRDKLNIDDISPRGLITDLLQKAKNSVSTIRSSIGQKIPIFNRNRLSKRHSKSSRGKKSKIRGGNYNYIRKVTRKPHRNLKTNSYINKYSKKPVNHKPAAKPLDNTQEKSNNKLVNNENIASVENAVNTDVRKKRSIDDDAVEISAENDNDMDMDFKEKHKEKLWKMLKKIHDKLKLYSAEKGDNSLDSGLVLRTQLSDDSATIKVKDSENGVLKSTVRNVLHVLQDLNSNMNKFWDTVDLLD